MKSALVPIVTAVGLSCLFVPSCNPADPSAIQEAFKAGTEPGLADQGPLSATDANANNPNGKTVDQGTGGLY